MKKRAGPGWHGSVEGKCPLQGSSRVDGLAWYFRARGNSWSMEIVDDECINPDQLPLVGDVAGWLIEEDWCIWSQAGYMTATTAWPLIEKCVAEFRGGKMPYFATK